MWGRRFRLPTHMFYRRRLPHWHPDISEATFLFVTWRLSGSIPRTRLSPPASAQLSAGRRFLGVRDMEMRVGIFSFFVP